MKRALLIASLGVAWPPPVMPAFTSPPTAPARAEMCSPAPELAWLKQEFKLDDAQFERVRQLHAGYLPQCPPDPVNKCGA